MNQLYASGKSIFKSQLKKDLNLQIKEIKLLKELSDEEKNPKIFGPEMIRITRDFEEWIAKNHPGLLDSFREEHNENISD